MITPFMKIIGWVVVLFVILLIYNFIRLIPEKAKVEKGPIDIRDYNNLQKKINKLNEQGIRLKVIGDKKPFSKKLFKILINSENLTKKNKTLQINLAFLFEYSLCG